MQVDRRPDDCRICSKPTASSVSEKKRLTLLGLSAEPVRHIMKCYILESLRITDFSFEEPQFHAGDYICSSCVILLSSYDKAKKLFEELEQAVIPTAERSPSVVFPIRRRHARPPGDLTSTSKRLRLEPLAMGLPGHGQPSVAPAPAPVKVYAIIVCMCNIYSRSCMHIIMHVQLNTFLYMHSFFHWSYNWLCML